MDFDRRAPHLKNCIDMIGVTIQHVKLDKGSAVAESVVHYLEIAQNLIRSGDIGAHTLSDSALARVFALNDAPEFNSALPGIKHKVCTTITSAISQTFPLARGEKTLTDYARTFPEGAQGRG